MSLVEPIAGQTVVNGQTIMHGGDSGLFVTFYTKGVKLEEQSRQAGRPIYRDETFCKIITPGDALNVWDQRVRESDKIRFAKQWDMFQRGMEQAQDGTPLEQWTRMTPAKMMAYKAVHIGTVEQVAAIADSNGSHMPMDWQNDRIAAQAYLQAAQDSSVVQRQAEALAERDARIKLLEGNLADLGGKLDQLMLRLPAEAPKGRSK